MIVKQSPILSAINFFLHFIDLFVSHPIDYESSTIDSDRETWEKMQW